MRRHFALKTEVVEPPPMSEEKLALAVLQRAIQDIEKLDRVITKKEEPKSTLRRQAMRDGWDAVAFFFSRRCQMRSFWLNVAGVDLRNTRWGLLDKYPWITDKFSRTGGSIICQRSN